MIAAWMAYSLVIARRLSRLPRSQQKRLRKRQSRWTWVAALAISAVLLLIACRFESAVRTEKQIDDRVLLSALGRTSFIEASPIEWIGGIEAAATAGPSNDDWLLMGWVVLPAAFAGFGAIGAFSCGDASGERNGRKFSGNGWQVARRFHRSGNPQALLARQDFRSGHPFNS